MKRILLLVAMLCFLLCLSSAQQRFVGTSNQQLGVNNIATQVKRSEPWQDNLKEYNSFFSISKEWPIPEENFYPTAEPQPAGDLNNDGFDDFITFNGICADERTAKLDDKCYKSMIFYGNNNGGFDTKVEYRNIIPIGDVNGDGYGDAFIQEYQEEFSIEYYLYIGSKDGFVLIDSDKTYKVGIVNYINIDLNKDGVNDCLFLGANNSINVVYGSKVNKSISTTIVDSAFKNYYSCINVEGSYILFYYSDSTTLKKYQFDTNKYDTFSNAGNIFNNGILFDYADVNNDGSYELISYNKISKITFYKAFTKDSDIRNLERVVCDYPGLLIGDVNNDKLPEFMIFGNNNLMLANIELYNYASIYNTTTIEFDIDNLSYSYYRRYINNRSLINDYNNDGFKEMIVLSNSKHTSTYKTLRVDKQKIISDNILKFDFNNLERILTNKTCNLGDINGDGLDDIALYNNEKIDIFTNGNLTTPAFSIKNESDNIKINKIAAADLNNDGYSDWIVGYYSYQNFENSRIDIYYGSATPTIIPAKMINIANALDIAIYQYMPQIEYGFNIIGSVDGDNYPELLMFNTSDRDKNKVFIFKGAETFPDKPATTIDFASNFGDDNIKSESYRGYIGSSAVSLDDINNDGINDFVIADIFRPGVDPNMKINGCLFIYHGKADLNFTTPEKILYNRTFDISTNAFSDISNYGMYLVSGDYNGDEIKDIAVSGISFKDNDNNAAPGVDIYYGGNSISDTPNKSLYVKAKNNLTGDYSNLNSLGGLTNLPDINGDKADELIVTIDGLNHGVGYLYLGSEDFNENPVAVINEATPLGGAISMNNYYYSRFPLPIAKFTNKNVPEFLSISRDINYLGNTVALYKITDPSNTAPKNLSLSNDVVAEDSPVGTEVGVFSATDIDLNDVLTYTIADNKNFKVEGDKLVTKSTFDFETKSEYKVVATVTDAKGDIDQKEFIISITKVKTTAIDKAVNANVKLYPNPAVTTITIETSVLINRVDIVNILGNVVYSQTVNATNTTIDISNLQSGIYNIKGYTSEGVITKKFVKR